MSILKEIHHVDYTGSYYAIIAVYLYKLTGRNRKESSNTLEYSVIDIIHYFLIYSTNFASNTRTYTYIYA